MQNATLRLIASMGLFVVGAVLVIAFAALLDRRVTQPPPVKRPSPWIGLICVVVGAWGAIVEYSLRRQGVAGMTCAVIWGAFVVFGAIQLSRSIGWRPRRDAGEIAPTPDDPPGAESAESAGGK